MSRPVLKKQGSQSCPQSRGLDLQMEEIRDRKGQSWLEASGVFPGGPSYRREQVSRVLAMWPWADCCPYPSCFLFCHMRAAVLACLSLGTSFRLETRGKSGCWNRHLSQELQRPGGPLSHPGDQGFSEEECSGDRFGIGLRMRSTGLTALGTFHTEGRGM